MSWFKRKTDPIKEREASLNAEIAAIEAEIKKLNASLEEGSPRTNAKRGKTLFGGSGGGKQARGSESGAGQESGSGQEPIFEAMPQNRVPPEWSPGAAQEEEAAQAPLHPSSGWWRRLKQVFRRATPSNPQLVNYLAAGSLHGVRPLRYEKRLARNRVILLAIGFGVTLWIVASLLAGP